MKTFIKFVLTIFGGMLVGFGVGLLMEKSGVIHVQYRDIALALSLISGGFFIAMGIPAKKTDKDLVEYQQLPQQPQS